MGGYADFVSCFTSQEWRFYSYFLQAVLWTDKCLGYIEAIVALVWLGLLIRESLPLPRPYLPSVPISYLPNPIPLSHPYPTSVLFTPNPGSPIHTSHLISISPSNNPQTDPATPPSTPTAPPPQNTSPLTPPVRPSVVETRLRLQEAFLLMGA